MKLYTYHEDRQARECAWHVNTGEFAENSRIISLQQNCNFLLNARARVLMWGFGNPLLKLQQACSDGTGDIFIHR